MLNWVKNIKTYILLCLFISQIAIFDSFAAQSPQDLQSQEAKSGSEINPSIDTQQPNAPADDEVLGNDMLNAFGSLDAEQLIKLKEMLDGLSSPVENDGDDSQTPEERLQKTREQARIAAEREQTTALENLPQDLRFALERAEFSYKKFVRSVDIRYGFTNLCQKIETQTEQLADTNRSEETVQDLQKTKVLLQKLKDAIKTGSLAALPTSLAMHSSDERMSNPGLAKFAEFLNGEGSIDDIGNEGDELEQSQNIPAENLQVKESVGLEQKKIFFEKTDFSELLSIFKKLWPIIKNPGNEKLQKLILHFGNILVAVRNAENIDKNDVTALDKKRLVMIKNYLSYIHPLQTKTYNLLKTAREAFDTEYEKMYSTLYEPAMNEAIETSSELKLTKEQQSQFYAIHYFQEEKFFESKIENMLAFAALRSNANSIFLGTEKLFDAVSLLYDVSGHFVNFIKEDCGLTCKNDRTTSEERLKANFGWWGATSYDWIFKISLFSWYVKYKSSSNATAMLANSVLNGQQLDGLSAMTKQNTLQAFTEALLKLIAPNLTKMRYPGIKKYYEDVATSIIHVGAAAIYSGIKNQGARGIPTDKHFKNAIFGCAGTIGTLAFNEFENKLYELMPNAVEICDKYSFGVIRPSMIKYFVGEMTPVFLYTQAPFNRMFNDYSKFRETSGITTVLNKGEDRYAALDGTGIKDIVKKYEIKHPKAFNNEDDMSLIQFQFERCVISWILSCVGERLGTIIAGYATEPIWNGILKSVDFGVNKSLGLLQKVNIISNEDKELWGAVKDGLIEQKTMALRQLSSMLGQAFIPNNPYHGYILSVLEARGEITKEEMADNGKRNRIILRKLLDIMRYNKLLTPAETSAIMMKFDKTKQPYVSRKILQDIVDLFIKKHVLSLIVTLPFGKIFNSFITEKILSRGTITDGIRWLSDKYQITTNAIAKGGRLAY